VAESLTALGLLRSDQAHLEEAEQLVHDGLEMDRRHLPPNHPALAKANLAYGKVLAQRGFYDRAITALNEAVRIQSAPGVAPADRLTALAESLTYQNKYDDAVAALEQALAIQERVYGPAHPSVAETVNELGNVASMRDHLDEAEARFRRAVEIYRAVYGDHHYLVAIALSNVAGIYMDKKDYPRAEQ